MSEEELTNEQKWWGFAYSCANKLGFSNRPSEVKGEVIFFTRAVDSDNDLLRISRSKFIDILKGICKDAPHEHE